MKKEIKELIPSYDEDLTRCINELIYLVKNNKNITFDNIYDNPIYPVNEELKNDFTDQHGFDLEDFILYLIKRSDILENKYSEEIENFIIALV